jgi:hypothetical protein
MPDKRHPDAVVPPVLAPPAAATPTERVKAGNYLGLWMALAVVLLLGLVVIFALPALLQSPPQATAPAEPVAAQGTADRDQANQTMQEWLQLRAQLELEKASRWGEPDWSRSQAAADSGARQFAQRQFREAADSYQQALQGLKQLAGERDSRLSTALATAQQALSDNQPELAAERFQLVLAIDEDNDDARAGLARSSARASVLEHMAVAERAEADADLLAAQLAYQQATLLDPGYEPAAVALQRVSGVLATRAFQEAMTQALTALDSGQLGAAEKSLAGAAALRPSDAAVIDAQQRLAQARQQGYLNRLRRQAESLAAAENWQAVRRQGLLAAALKRQLRDWNSTGSSIITLINPSGSMQHSHLRMPRHCWQCPAVHPQMSRSWRRKGLPCSAW